ncbi:MAG: protein kinase [Candidatus Margulisiibacteriota bacterium]|nr:protein kinase [Candidatus Margulisiibacteriota bacterium]
MPALSAVALYRRIQSSLTSRAVRSPYVNSKTVERNGRQYLSISSPSRLLLTALAWMHKKNVLYPFGHPFFKLSGNTADKTRKVIDLKLPRDIKSYETLAEHIKNHPSPADKGFNKEKGPFHLDDVIAIAAKVADGIAVAEDVNVLLRISPEGIVARNSRTAGSEFREWDLFFMDLNHASLTKDGYRGIEGLDRDNLSPEEIRGDNSTVYSERYRLGILLYTLLTRKNPFKALRAEYNGKPPQNLAKLLETRLRKENDPLLTARLEFEPKFAQKEIYALLKGLLAREGSTRITAKEMFEHLRKLEERYIIHIDTALTNGNGPLHVGMEYRIKENINKLGEGGMANVVEFDAYKTGVGWRKLKGAAKVTKMDSEFQEYFETELNILHLLKDLKNVISVVRSNIHGELAGFRDKTGSDIVENHSMVEGRAIHFERIYDTLNAKARIKPIKSAEQLYDVLEMLIRIGETLKKIHARGIFHRDLKFENIGMRDASWNPEGIRILDFGVAVDTHNKEQMEKEAETSGLGLIKGTPFYMSPEMTRGEIDLKTDVYSLATMFYELLYGKKGANIKVKTLREALTQITRGHRLNIVLETLKNGSILLDNNDLAAGPSLKKRDQVKAKEREDADVFEADTLDFKKNSRDFDIINGQMAKRAGPETGLARLNGSGKEVRRRLVSIFTRALATDPKNRNSMAQFVYGLQDLREYIDITFGISEKRVKTRRGRFA